MRRLVELAVRVQQRVECGGRLERLAARADGRHGVRHRARLDERARERRLRRERAGDEERVLADVGVQVLQQRGEGVRDAALQQLRRRHRAGVGGAEHVEQRRECHPQRRLRRAREA